MKFHALYFSSVFVMECTPCQLRYGGGGISIVASVQLKKNFDKSGNLAPWVGKKAHSYYSFFFFFFFNLRRWHAHTSGLTEHGPGDQEPDPSSPRLFQL